YDAVESPWSDYGLDDESLEAQRMLTEWDTRALGEARALFTTSGVVADRLARYNGLTGEPLYHPPPLFDALRPGPFGDYVFCPTRSARRRAARAGRVARRRVAHRAARLRRRRPSRRALRERARGRLRPLR